MVFFSFYADTPHNIVRHLHSAQKFLLQQIVNGGKTTCQIASNFLMVLMPVYLVFTKNHHWHENQARH
jgi:hypothetical protein